MNILATGPRAIKIISLVSIALVILVSGFIYSRKAAPTVSAQPARTIISQRALEEQYGLRVLLVAVTAAGGWVDVRVKIVDGEKARLLLSDKNNFPALLTANDVILIAPEDTRSQAIKFDNGGAMFIMYVNSANAVKSGDPVAIVFGDLQLEAINAR